MLTNRRCRWRAAPWGSGLLVAGSSPALGRRLIAGAWPKPASRPFTFIPRTDPPVAAPVLLRSPLVVAGVLRRPPPAASHLSRSSLTMLRRARTLLLLILTGLVVGHVGGSGLNRRHVGALGLDPAAVPVLGLPPGGAGPGPVEVDAGVEPLTIPIPTVDP